jgi:hypothetical protein
VSLKGFQSAASFKDNVIFERLRKPKKIYQYIMALSPGFMKNQLDEIGLNLKKLKCFSKIKFMAIIAYGFYLIVLFQVLENIFDSDLIM